MKSMVLLVSIAFVVVSCATPGREPELTKQPELPALEEAMDTIAGRLPAESHQMVAVFSFAERGIGPTLLGEYVAEKLMMALSATGRVELVERNRLDAVTKEQKLGATGLIDDATAASIGNIAGAQAALVGTLTNFEDYWELTARLLGTSDGRVLAMADGRFSAQDVPPNLAGQPIVSRRAPLSERSEGLQRERPSIPTMPRPVDRPVGVQEAPAHRPPPLHVILQTCREITDRGAKRRCFDKLRSLILTGPRTPQKDAASRCLEIPNPRQRTRCLQRVIGEPRR
jgi:hypothetical protein